MKTKSDYMKGEKEKIMGSCRKEGFPWGTDWQIGILFVRFLRCIKPYIFIRKYVASASGLGAGRPTWSGARHGSPNNKENLIKK